MTCPLKQIDKVVIARGDLGDRLLARRLFAPPGESAPRLTAISGRTSWPETSHDDRTAEYRARGHILAASGGSFESAIAPDQCIGRAVVLELWLSRSLELGNNPLGESLAQFHAPLIE